MILYLFLVFTYYLFLSCRRVFILQTKRNMLTSVTRVVALSLALSLVTADGMAEMKSCHDIPDSSLPCVEVPICSSDSVGGTLILDDLANGAGSSTATSTIHLCYDQENLHVTHIANDQLYFTPNEAYSECNSGIFSSDVVELFIAPYMEKEPHCYNELDISPYFGGVRFDTGIYNANLNQTGISGTEFGCEGQPGYTNMTTAVAVDEQNHQWTATLTFNWALLNCPVGCPLQAHYCGRSTPNTVYRANFFRIHQLLEDRKQCKAGENNKEDSCEYMAWSPTDVSPPAFHVPTKFGYVVLI